MTTCDLKNLAYEVRKQVVEMGYYANSMNKGAHYGGGLSCVEIMSVLYGSAMNISKENIANKDRDLFIPGKAHCILPQFAVLKELGYISEEDKLSFAHDGGVLYGHAAHFELGVDFPGGSLGMALPVCVGMAYARKLENKQGKVFCLLGDGECNEGSVWEAALSASHYKLENLITVVDRNYVQLDGETEQTMALGNMEEKFKTFGWKTITVDGHNIEALEKAFNMEHGGKPLAIIANTVKGKGVSFMEGKWEWHFSRMTKSQYEQAKGEVEGGE